MLPSTETLLFQLGEKLSANEKVWSIFIFSVILIIKANVDKTLFQYEADYYVVRKSAVSSVVV